MDNSSYSFNLVPIGAFFGKGEKAEIYGSYLLACYDSTTKTYEAICKLGTGFSQDDLVNFHKFFQAHVVKAQLPEYKAKPDEVDAWFEPCVVWEIRAADIQVSPVYYAGIGKVDPNRGLGLRFPRLIKVRDDKSPTEATESSLIVDVYKSQTTTDNSRED